MSFDKTYPNRKDWRKPYLGAKKWASGCRVHGHCSICRGNRLHGTVKNQAAARDELAHDWPEEATRPAMLTRLLSFRRLLPRL